MTVYCYRSSKLWVNLTTPAALDVAFVTSVWMAFLSLQMSIIRFTASTIITGCSLRNAPAAEKASIQFYILKLPPFSNFILFYRHNSRRGHRGNRASRIHGQRLPRRLLFVRRVRHAADRRTRQALLSSQRSSSMSFVSHHQYILSAGSIPRSADPCQLSIHGIVPYND